MWKTISPRLSMPQPTYIIIKARPNRIKLSPRAKIKSIYKNKKKKSSTQQGKIHFTLGLVKGYQNQKKQENMTNDMEHSLETDPVLIQLLELDEIAVAIFSYLMRTLNTYSRSLMNPKQKKHMEKTTHHQIPQEW